MAGISRNQAARLLKKSPRTISRMVERGELTTNDEGRFSKEEVEELAELEEEEDTTSEASKALEILKDVTGLLMENNQTMMKLLEGPHNALLSTLARTNDTQMARITSMETHHIRNLEVMGELYSMSSESKAAEIAAEGKARAMREAAPLLKLVAAKFMGGVPPAAIEGREKDTIAAPSGSAVESFFGSLDGSQRAQLVAIGPMIAQDSRQLSLFRDAMTELGFQLEDEK